MKKSAQRDANTARAGCCKVRTRTPPARPLQPPESQIGPITIHCAAKLSAQCNNASSATYRSNCSKPIRVAGERDCMVDCIIHWLYRGRTLNTATRASTQTIADICSTFQRCEGRRKIRGATSSALGIFRRNCQVPVQIYILS